MTRRLKNELPSLGEGDNHKFRIKEMKKKVENTLLDRVVTFVSFVILVLVIFAALGILRSFGY